MTAVLFVLRRASQQPPETVTVLWSGCCCYGIVLSTGGGSVGAQQASEILALLCADMSAFQLFVACHVRPTTDWFHVVCD